MCTVTASLLLMALPLSSGRLENDRRLTLLETRMPEGRYALGMAMGKALHGNPWQQMFLHVVTLQSHDNGLH